MQPFEKQIYVYIPAYVPNILPLPLLALAKTGDQQFWK
jgi:hypothetical protein